VKVIINGEPREVSARTVFALLEELGLPPGRIVVEQNAAIVRRDAYQDAPVREGDILELVRIVGGG